MKLMATALTLSTALLFSPMTKAMDQKLNAFDVEWLKHTAEADMFEIELGALAQKKCSHISGQMLGEMLVKDHSTHLDKVKTLAAAKGVVLSTVPNPTQVLVLRYFVTSKSPDWCYDFAQYGVEDHKNEIAYAEDETFLGDDAEVVLLAQKTIPTLQKHLEMAKDVAAEILDF
jgi:putative membrane protein